MLQLWGCLRVGGRQCLPACIRGCPDVCSRAAQCHTLRSAIRMTRTHARSLSSEGSSVGALHARGGLPLCEECRALAGNWMRMWLAFAFDGRQCCQALHCMPFRGGGCACCASRCLAGQAGALQASRWQFGSEHRGKYEACAVGRGPACEWWCCKFSLAGPGMPKALRGARTPDMTC